MEMKILQVTNTLFCLGLLPVLPPFSDHIGGFSSCREVWIFLSVQNLVGEKVYIACEEEQILCTGLTKTHLEVVVSPGLYLRVNIPCLCSVLF